MGTDAQNAQAEIEQSKTYNADDPEQVQEQKSRAGRIRRRMLERWAGVMSVPEGRELIYRLLLACDIHRSTYIASEDERAAAFREGRRYIGLQILADIKAANMDFWIQMEREAMQNKWEPLYPIDGLL